MTDHDTLNQWIRSYRPPAEDAPKPANRSHLDVGGGNRSGVMQSSLNGSERVSAWVQGRRIGHFDAITDRR